MQFNAPDSEPQAEGFEDWETNEAKAVVYGFMTARGPFRNLMFEELLQEALTTWWLERSRYDAGRGASQKTFLNRVVTNRLLDLLREELSLKRQGDRTAATLDQLAADEDAGLLDRLTALDRGDDPQKAAEESELVYRVRRAQDRLSPRQRALAEGLEQDKTVSALSKELGISRVTFYKERQRIRHVFEKEGLADFLNGPT